MPARMTTLNGLPESQSKKRRIPGACDICKRKKVRCDSGTMPGNRCSNCLQFGYECTHLIVTKSLGPAKSYVESLEARLEMMNKLLNKLVPEFDVKQELNGMDQEDEDSIVASEICPVDEDDLQSKMRRLNLQKLELNPQDHIFFGKSSGYHLIQTAFDLKQEYTGDPIWSPKTTKRTEFWEIPKWATKDHALEKHWPHIYPDADLIPSLIDAYFLNFNIFIPLLHRPTFEKSVAEGLHLSDSMFSSTLLLVCAHGSRYSEDPRVLAEGSDNPRSAGWKWFEQVNVFRSSLYQRTGLYELQMHALYIMFAQSSEIPEGIWSQVGLALRLSQEVGAHRRRRKKDVSPSAEDELWKRAFWVLLTLDRNISSLTGRPCCLNDEDFDLDLPIECDDEYWDNGFQQPSGKPSLITFFTSLIRLTDILAYAMRLIYPIRPPDDKIFNVTPRSDQQVIAQLDSAMNSWMDTVPSHLKWNPNNEHTLFLKQSAVLYATYYNLQIFIHRPFIPAPRNPSRVTFPSLAICTNAARSCCHILESFAKWSAIPFASTQGTAFTAAVILLLNIWSGKRSGQAPNPRREMQGVQRCMEILKDSERRWASAGRCRDILRELAFAGDLSIVDNINNDQCQDIPRKKRPRDVDDDSTDVSPEAPPSRSTAGMRRASTDLPVYVQQQQQSPNFSLPMYSNELGRLPIYGQFHFSDSVSSVPVQPSEDFVDMVSGLVGTSYNIPGAYATNPFFEGQTMGNLVDHNPGASCDLTGVYPGDAFDIDSLSLFGTTPAMDNATMAVWSAAPTNLEMEDWKSYIHSFEQMTQAQSLGYEP